MDTVEGNLRERKTANNNSTLNCTISIDSVTTIRP